MCKYISTLERLDPNFGIEIFHASHLKPRKVWEENASLPNGTYPQCESRAPATYEIMVNGNKGIWWRISTQAVSKNVPLCFCLLFYLSFCAILCSLIADILVM